MSKRCKAPGLAFTSRVLPALVTAYRERFPPEGVAANQISLPSFFANLGPIVIDSLSEIKEERVEEVEPHEYYASVGHDGQGLRVPSDLDDSICRYLHLASANRAKFDRAAF